MVSEEAEKRVKVFFSYHKQDEKLRQALEMHLSILKRKGFIYTWHFRKLHAGMEQVKEINAHLNTAHIILLLVSPHYIDSDYCFEIEVKRAMERHEAREATVIPIILRPVDWTETPFSKLEPLPKDGKPVTIWRNRDQAFADISLGIRIAAENILGSKEEQPIKITKNYLYDFVLSYASEDRSYAETLANSLRLQGMKILCYSQDINKRMNLSLGKSHHSYLFAPYQEQSRYYVIFLSQNYITKEWTKGELESDLASELKEKEYLIIRLDKTDFPGIDECLWWEKMTIEDITELLVGKVKEVTRITPYDY
jgi:hypothetical protein